MPATVTASTKNRRRSQRRKPRSTVKVECRKGFCGLGPNLSKVVLDLSDTGVCLVICVQLEQLDEVELVITGYGMKQTLKRHGNVRWQVKLESGEFCVGIEFQKQLPYREWQNLASAN